MVPNLDHMVDRMELTAAAIFHAEQVRLQRIHYQIRMIFGDGVRLTEVVDAMIEELDSTEVQDIVQ